jgi:hypothetical protein
MTARLPRELGADLMVFAGVSFEHVKGMMPLMVSQQPLSLANFSECSTKHTYPLSSSRAVNPAVRPSEHIYRAQ